MILYGQDDSDKFIKNESTCRNTINPKYISGIVEYNAIKDLIINLSNADRTKVNVVIMR